MCQRLICRHIFHNASLIFNTYMNSTYLKNAKSSSVKSKRGFTLIETLVAISILLVAITGPLSVIATSLRSSYFSRDEITASYLAQEPIEFIRNMRDQNGLRNDVDNSWLDGIVSDLITGQTYINDPGSRAIKLNLVRNNGKFEFRPCDSLGCIVKYDDVTGIYGAVDTTTTITVGGGSSSHTISTVNSVPQSVFFRDVYINQVESDVNPIDESSNREILITVVVSWRTGVLAHNIVVSERLFNWQLQSES